MTTATIENRYRLGHPDHDDYPAYRLLLASQIEIVQGIQLDRILMELQGETGQTIPEDLLRDMGFKGMQWQQVTDATNFIPNVVFLGFNTDQLEQGKSQFDQARGAIALQRQHPTLSNQVQPHHIKLSGLLADSSARLHVVDLAYNANGEGELHAVGVSKPEQLDEQNSHSLITLPIDYRDFHSFAGIITPEMVALTDDGKNGPHGSLARADYNNRKNQPTFNGTSVRDGWWPNAGMGNHRMGSEYKITSEQPGGIVDWHICVPAHLMNSY